VSPYAESYTSETPERPTDREERRLYEPSWQHLSAHDQAVKDWEAEPVEHVLDRGMSPFGKAGKIRSHKSWYEQYHRLGAGCHKVHGCQCGSIPSPKDCQFCHDDWLQQWEIFYYDEENPAEIVEGVSETSSETVQGVEDGSSETSSETLQGVEDGSSEASSETVQGVEDIPSGTSSEPLDWNLEKQAPLGGSLRIRPSVLVAMYT
jgi:hypothetical protein